LMTNRVLRASLTLVLAVAIGSAMGVAGAAGRYKKDGKRCVWDEKDSGPRSLRFECAASSC